MFDFALVAMLSLLGLRIFEACGADIIDVGEEHGHRVLRVHGKGTKVRVGAAAAGRWGGCSTERSTAVMVRSCSTGAGADGSALRDPTIAAVGAACDGCQTLPLSTIGFRLAFNLCSFGLL